MTTGFVFQPNCHWLPKNRAQQLFLGRRGLAPRKRRPPRPPALVSWLLGYRRPTWKRWRVSEVRSSGPCTAGHLYLLCRGLPPRLGFSTTLGTAPSTEPGTGRKERRGGCTLPSALLGNLPSPPPPPFGKLPFTPYPDQEALNPWISGLWLFFSIHPETTFLVFFTSCGIFLLAERKAWALQGDGCLGRRRLEDVSPSLVSQVRLRASLWEQPAGSLFEQTPMWQGFLKSRGSCGSKGWEWWLSAGVSIALFWFFSFSCVISCPFGNRARVVAGCLCEWLIFSMPHRSNMFPALEAELKQKVGTHPSPGTPQKSSTRSECICWWHLFLAGDLDPQDRMICVNISLGLFTEVKYTALCNSACLPFVKSSVLFERTSLIEMAFPFTDSSWSLWSLYVPSPPVLWLL